MCAVHEMINRSSTIYTGIQVHVLWYVAGMAFISGWGKGGGGSVVGLAFYIWSEETASVRYGQLDKKLTMRSIGTVFSFSSVVASTLSFMQFLIDRRGNFKVSGVHKKVAIISSRPTSNIFFSFFFFGFITGRLFLLPNVLPHIRFTIIGHTFHTFPPTPHSIYSQPWATSFQVVEVSAVFFKFFRIGSLISLI